MKDTTVSLAEVSNLPHSYMKAVYSDTCGVCGNSNSPLHHNTEVLDKLARAMMTVELGKHLHKTMEDALSVPSEVLRTYKRLLVSGEASKMLAEIEKVGMHLVVKFRFEETSCSSCGRSFGPGNHGYSHCKNHAGRIAQ